MRVFRIIGRGAVAFYDELPFYILTGLLHLVAWVLVLIPLAITLSPTPPASAFAYTSWLLVIPGPIALVGVYTVGQRAVRGEGVKWHIIWQGIKEYAPRSMLLFFTIFLLYFIIVMNVWFYRTPDVSPFPPSVAIWTTPVFLSLALLWSGIAFYAEAFLLELKEPTMKLIFRNSFFLMLLQPIQTLILLIVFVLSLALSIAIPLLLIIWPGFVSCLSLTAVRQSVAHFAERAETLKQEAEEKEQVTSIAVHAQTDEKNQNDR